MRVRSPDKDGRKKLQRLLSYLNITINSVNPPLNANDLNVVHWWVDASHGTHTDLKGRTGVTIYTGKGCVTSASKKQKVNTTNSTIIEVVGVHKASTQVLWTRDFLQNQGFEVDKATMYQDNMSAILLEKNRRASSSSQKNTS